MEDAYPQPIYFIGISLPEELDRRISALQWKLKDNDRHLLKPLLPHVTLLNPPSLEGIMPDELLPRVHEVAKRYLPLTLACQEIDFFGRSVAFIRIQSQGLYSLQSQLVRLLPPEAQTLHYRRPYTPHITLAQAYDPSDLDVRGLREQLPAELMLPFQFTVDSLSYFQRILPRTYRATNI